MKNLLKLTAPFALLLASWMAPGPVSAVPPPYYCHCNWCSNYVDAPQTRCQNPYNETPTTCGDFYSYYCPL